MGAIQLVVGDAAVPSATDVLIKSWVEAIGHTVTYVDDDTAENTTGFNGIVIADSCATGSLGTKYVAVALPVVLHEGFYVDTMKMVSAESADEFSGTTIEIVNPAHPFVNGPYGSFSGTLTWATATAPVLYADDAVVDFGAGVNFVVERVGFPTFKALYAYEAGAALADASAAPAKRAMFIPRNLAGSLVNADGIKVLKNIYAWAFGNQGAAVAWLGA